MQKFTTIFRRNRMKALHLNTTGLARLTTVLLLAIAGSLASHVQAQTLVGYWDFDELPPGNAVVGGNTVQDTAASYPGAVDGVNHVGNAMGALNYVDSLAGFGSAIDFPNQNGAEIVVQNSGTAFGFQPGDFTISLWVNNRGFTRTWQAAIAKGEGNAWRVARQGNNQLLGIAANIGQDMPNNFVGNFVDNQWHHIAFTRQSTGNNATLTYWFDGVPFMDNAAGDTLDPRTGSPLTFGDNPQGNNRNWNGLMDDIAIWDATILCYKPPAIYHAGVQLGYSMQEMLLLFDAYDNQTSVTFNDPLTGNPVTWDYTGGGLKGMGTVENAPGGLGIQIGDDFSGMTLAVQTAEPSITKTASLVEGAPGDLVTYDIAFQNGSTTPFEDVQFVDTLPAGMIFQSPAHNLGSVVAIDPAGNNVVVAFTAVQTGNTLTLSLPAGYSLAGPNNLQFNVFAQVDPAQTAPVECLRNDIEVSGFSANAAQSASASATVVSLIPDVAVSKSVTNITTGAAVSGAGDILEYTVTISNSNSQAGLTLTDVVSGGTIVPGSVTAGGSATVNMTPTSLEITWPAAAGSCVQTVGEQGAAEFAGGFHIDDPNYPSPILSASDATTFDPALNPLGGTRLFFHADDWWGGNYNWTQNGGNINNKNFNNGGGNVGSVGMVCSDAAAWVGENRMAVFTGAGGFTAGSLNNISAQNRKTFVWHISPQSLNNGRQIVYETGGAGTGTSLVLIDSRLYWTANFNPDFGQAVVDLSTIDYDPLVDFIRVVAVISKNIATPAVRLGAYNRCGQGVTDVQPIQDANGNGLGLGNWAGGDGAGLGQQNGGSIGGDQGGRVTNLEGGGAYVPYIGAIATMEVYDNGANLPAPAPTSATCNCGNGTGYAGDGAISSGLTDPCWLTTTTFSRNNNYNHGGSQQDSENIARLSKNHPEYGSSLSDYREVIDFSNSGNVQRFVSIDPQVGGVALFPNVGTQGGSDRFSNYSRGYILVETPGPYSFGVTHDDTMRLYIDGARVLAFNCCSGAGRFTTVNLTAGLHYIEAFVGENGGGDYIEVFWDPEGTGAYELTELADTVIYTTTVQACSDLGQWGKLSVDSIANAGFVATEVLDAGGNVLIGSTTNATEIDLSAIPASTTDLVLRFTLKNEGCLASEGPLLEGWDASFICGNCSSVTSFTYQVEVDKCHANVAAVDNLATVTTPGNELSISNNTAATSSPLGPFYDLEVSATGTAAAPPSNAFFTVTVANNGGITSSMFTVDAVVGASVTVASAPAGCTLVGNTVSCALPALAPGGSTSLVIEVESACCFIGGADVTATVVAMCPDEDPSNDTATTQFSAPGDSTEPVVTVEPPDFAGICNVQPEPPLQAIAILDIFNGTGVDISLLPALNTGLAEATDTCSLVTSYVDQATVFGCVANIVRTWTFLDECGLSTTYDQDINITLDTTPPVITADPSSPTMAVCTGGPITDEWTAGASVTDDCDVAPVVSYTNVSVATACGEMVTRTWTAVDACGNTATVVQVFENTFNDTAGPTLVPPADVSGCDLDTSPAALGVALSSDDCTAATTPADCIVVNGDFENGDLLGWSLFSSGTGTFRINDGVFDPFGPTPATAACGGNFSAVNEVGGPGLRQMWQDVAIPAAPSATLSWSDQIFNPAGTFLDPVQEFRVLIIDPATGAILATAFSTNPGDAPNQPCTARSADVTPFAGQTVRIMFEVEDSASPLNVYIDDVCIDINPVTPTFADTITTVGCTQVIERVWTSSDVCGNASTATQMIENVLDTTPPVLTLPPDTNGCAIATDVAANGSATAVDACGAVTVTNTDQIVMQGDNTIVLRTWTATDGCGNVTEGLQTIISLDVFGGPVITVPPDTTACNGATNMTDTGMGMVLDGCCATGSVTVTVADVVSAGAAACEEIITRTWTASDDCGNTTTASQTITNYVDATPPVIVVPAPVALCNGFTDPASVGMATATDDCLLVTNTWADTVTQSNCLEIIERVWTAVDFCGNIAVATQFINNVADAEPPVLTVPADTNGCNISTNMADTGMDGHRAGLRADRVPRMDRDR